jgi:hypothetical protein
MIYKRFSSMSRRGHFAVIAAAGLMAGFIATAMAAPPAQKAPAAGRRPALWRTYDMLINLQNLPRTYTCNQLWYEFRGILLRLGAWPYSINILPYNCSPSSSGYMRSPNVEARFQLPIFLAAAVKTAQATASERAIRLAPGEPKTLQAADCQLLQQIEQTMFTSIEGAQVEDDHFDCAASSPRAGDFHVTLRLPVVSKMPSAPTATSAQDPH